MPIIIRMGEYHCAEAAFSLLHYTVRATFRMSQTTRTIRQNWIYLQHSKQIWYRIDEGYRYSLKIILFLGEMPITSQVKIDSHAKEHVLHAAIYI